jgi:uncharacterized membrane protein
MILLHIIGGLLGLTSGAVALSAPKGANLHRKNGMAFVYAMVVLSTSGALMAVLIPERISVIAGLLTFYLVITALLTVRRRLEESRWIDVGAMVFALTIGPLSLTFGIQGLNQKMGLHPLASSSALWHCWQPWGSYVCCCHGTFSGLIELRVICGACASLCGSPRHPSFWAVR